MKWYDYLICVMAADHISAGIMQMNIVLVMIGGVGYIMWEHARKEQVSQ